MLALKPMAGKALNIPAKKSKAGPSLDPQPTQQLAYNQRSQQPWLPTNQVEHTKGAAVPEEVRACEQLGAALSFARPSIQLGGKVSSQSSEEVLATNLSQGSPIMAFRVLFHVPFDGAPILTPAHLF